MHQYRIEVCEYNEAGDNANPIPMLTLYADTHEDARALCANYQYE